VAGLTVTSELPDVVYPVFVWRDGYVYLAKTPLELCVHPRSMFAETVKQARSGEWHMVDAAGWYFDVADHKRVRPFGGLMGFAYRLTLSIFAAPVLTNRSELSLPEFKKKLAGAIRTRYRSDRDKGLVVQIIESVKAAESHAAAIAALPKLWS
jgi:hypothetical protein